MLSELRDGELGSKILVTLRLKLHKISLSFLEVLKDCFEQWLDIIEIVVSLLEALFLVVNLGHVQLGHQGLLSL